MENALQFEKLELLTARIQGLCKITTEMLDEVKAIGIFDLPSYCKSKNLQPEDVLSLLGYYSPQIGFLLLQLSTPRILLNLESENAVVGFLEPTYISTSLGTRMKLKREYILSGAKLVTHWEFIDNIVVSAKLGKKVALVKVSTGDLSVSYEIRLRGLATSIKYCNIDSYPVQEFTSIGLKDYEIALIKYSSMIDALASGIKRRLSEFKKDFKGDDADSSLEAIIDAFGIHILNEESFAKFYIDAYVELKALGAALKETIRHVHKQLIESEQQPR